MEVRINNAAMETKPHTNATALHGWSLILLLTWLSICNCNSNWGTCITTPTRRPSESASQSQSVSWCP